MLEKAGSPPMPHDEDEKTETQKTVRLLAGKRFLAAMGKPGASEADVENLCDAWEEFSQAMSFYRYGS